MGQHAPPFPALMTTTTTTKAVATKTKGHGPEDLQAHRQAGEEACERGEEGGWRQEGAGDEEGRQGYLRAEAAQRGARGDLRQEVDAAHRGHEVPLDVHQEKWLEQRPRHHSGRDA